MWLPGFSVGDRIPCLLDRINFHEDWLSAHLLGNHLSLELFVGPSGFLVIGPSDMLAGQLPSRISSRKIRITSA